MSKARGWYNPVTITLKEYNELCEAKAMLDALHAGGVDNWEWYDESLKEFREQLNNED